MTLLPAFLLMLSYATYGDQLKVRNDLNSTRRTTNQDVTSDEFYEGSGLSSGSGSAENEIESKSLITNADKRGEIMSLFNVRDIGKKVDNHALKREIYPSIPSNSTSKREGINVANTSGVIFTGKDNKSLPLTEDLNTTINIFNNYTKTKPGNENTDKINNTNFLNASSLPTNENETITNVKIANTTGLSAVVNSTTNPQPNNTNVTGFLTSIKSNNLSVFNTTSGGGFGNTTGVNMTLNEGMRNASLISGVSNAHFTALDGLRSPVMNDSTIIASVNGKTNISNSDRNTTKDNEESIITPPTNFTAENTSAVIPMNSTANTYPISEVKFNALSAKLITGNTTALHKNDTAAAITPRRSGNLVKPKKHLVFNIFKPKMMITDFANKRKHISQKMQ